MCAWVPASRLSGFRPGECGVNNVRISFRHSRTPQFGRTMERLATGTLDGWFATWSVNVSVASIVSYLAFPAEGIGMSSLAMFRTNVVTTFAAECRAQTRSFD